MKKLLTGAPVIAAMASGAYAGGLDRTGQSINVLFEEGGATGSYFELSFAQTSPDLSGKGVGIAAAGLPSGTSYSDVGNSFWSIGTALKVRFSDKLSGALIFDQPYGADVSYSGNPGSTELGGTSAFAETNAITALVRYKFDQRFSAYGGLRIQTAEGEIDLSGLAYGPTEAMYPALPSEARRSANGYSVDLDRDTALGYVIGAAYEIPEIALRASLTYSSEITHEMKTKESGPNVEVTIPGIGGVLVNPYEGSSTTDVKTPQSVNLDLQTGIAEDTLLFGSVRWVDWSEFRIDPKNFVNATGGGLVELEDTTTYQIGLGRRFNDQWAGSFAVSYEAETDKLVSPLAPSNGLWAVALGASYDMGDVKISGGARYTWLGDATPETGTPDVARADFKDNTALSLGMRIAYAF
ncbi:OmpP1/FadL family transporter [Tropicimonas sediminicola]|uniref:Long-chain fatty acid transport protein n=1 Tax=Tropicimonas sediminicola TaxID=1031541 RepID=A0A239EAU2_9RHOB|nr:outer membrane protein transport protein [Tropicimonas sediminicola]SNS41815.1 Long-chain fatty acid transport protein [Tropicimonas sediminicola]